MMLRINSGDIELVARSSDCGLCRQPLAQTCSPTLPQDTAAALYVTGGAERVKQQWADFLKQLPTAELLGGLGNPSGRIRTTRAIELSQASQLGTGLTGSPDNSWLNKLESQYTSSFREDSTLCSVSSSLSSVSGETTWSRRCRASVFDR